jgi:hypothetical protein
LSQSTKMLKQTGTRSVGTLLTWRNTGALALLLFGTTFLWLTPAFVGNGKATEGTAWTVTQILVIPTILGFSAAAWGIYKASRWWERLAIVSAIFGFAPLIPYWIATHSVAGTGTAAQGIGFHAVGNAAVLILLLTPPLMHWIEDQVYGAERLVT